MADTHHDEPDVPGFPTIQDEAADTPMWVPAMGLALLALMVLMLVYRVATGSTEMEGDAATEGEVAADVAAADGAAGADAQAEDDHAGHGH